MIKKLDLQVIGEMIESDYLDGQKTNGFLLMIEDIRNEFEMNQTTDHAPYGQYIVVSGNDYKYEYVLREKWHCMEIVNAELY